jgi:hypothetical protein
MVQDAKSKAKQVQAKPRHITPHMPLLHVPKRSWLAFMHTCTNTLARTHAHGWKECSTPTWMLNTTYNLHIARMHARTDAHSDLEARAIIIEVKARDVVNEDGILYLERFVAR